jgi:antitoxin component YwqK of YwqJK toxin-antitoxin module
MVTYFLLISFFNIILINTCVAGDKIYPLEKVSYNNSIAYDKELNTPITGIVREYSDSGVLLSETSYKEGKKDGVAKGYFDSGALLIERHFRNGGIVGVVKMYHENGVLAKEQTFKDGKMNGLETKYYKSGKLQQETVYKDGKPVSGYSYNEQGEKKALSF